MTSSRQKEFEGREEENEGEREDREDEEDDDDDDEEIKPIEHSPKSLKRGEACFLILLHLGYIHETKHVLVANILEEY